MDVNRYHNEFCGKVAGAKADYGITGTFAIDSTGTKFIDVVYDEAFDATPFVLPMVVDPTQTDAKYDTLMVTNRTASGCRISCNVSTASGTGGATAKFSWIAMGK